MSIRLMLRTQALGFRGGDARPVPILDRVLPQHRHFHQEAAWRLAVRRLCGGVSLLLSTPQLKTKSFQGWLSS